ncbi:MAG: hypothetical protein PHE56_04055 [Bacteroidales bacterium]|nr:hypothetical protein [Bacteroidales bacterium]
MDIYGKIAQKIREIAGTDKEMPAFFTAKVKAVNEQTCDVEIGDLELTDVRLRSVVNSSTEMLLLKPVIGSQVVVADLSAGKLRELVVIQYSEIKEYWLKIEETTLKVSSGGIELNGSGASGMVKVNDLVTWMAKVNADLSALQSLLSLTRVAGNGAPLGILFSPTTNAPTADQISNNKVKHG